ncbi:MAG: hypothetical protein KBT27_13115 [Prevotellaceae bacterium]|nr:hypothetical protein [Candidatus Faecinaster equi]
MKVVDIERVVILMRFIQYGWNDERKKSFDENLRMMLETQCEDLEEYRKQIRAETIEEILKLDRHYYKTYESGFIEEREVVFVGDILQLKEQNINQKNKDLCNSCINKGCVLQTGIIRNNCSFYISKESEEKEQNK